MKREFKLGLEGLREKVLQIAKEVKYVRVSWETIEGEWWDEHEVYWNSFASPMFILNSEKGVNDLIDYYTKTYNDPNVDKNTLSIVEDC